MPFCALAFSLGVTLTALVIVGLPDAAVKESRDRVSTAMTSSAFKFPMGRTTINLAPADVKKENPPPLLRQALFQPQPLLLRVSTSFPNRG